MPGFRTGAPSGGPLSGNSILFPRIKIPTPIFRPPNEIDRDYAEPILGPTDRIDYGSTMPLPGIPEKEYLLGEKEYPKYEDPQQIYNPNRLSNPEGGK